MRERARVVYDGGGKLRKKKVLDFLKVKKE